jgi:hypothetical protein
MHFDDPVKTARQIEWALLSIPAGAFVYVILSGEVEVFPVAVIGTFLLRLLILWLIRCPQCRHPTLRMIEMKPWWSWSLVKRCPKCGQTFSLSGPPGPPSAL